MNGSVKRETINKLEDLINSDEFDSWVQKLESSTKESFLGFAKNTFSIIEVYLYCRFLGYKGSILSAEKWLTSHFPKPDFRKYLVLEIDEMQNDIRQMRDAIETGSVKRDAGAARIAQLEKELRGTIEQVEKYTVNKDRKGLLMAGADRAIREIMYIFKDDPIENSLDEASMSVWARMNEEE
jgi:hypothetical protein